MSAYLRYLRFRYLSWRTRRLLRQFKRVSERLLAEYPQYDPSSTENP